MEEEINAYVDYLFGIKEINRAKMPKFDISAYTDNEYIKAIRDIERDYIYIDDIDVTIHHLTK